MRGKSQHSLEQNVALTREGSARDRRAVESTAELQWTVLQSASLGIRASWVSSDSRSHSLTGHLRTTVVEMRSSSGPVPALSKGALSQKSQVRIARSTSCPRGHLDKAAERSPCPKAKAKRHEDVEGSRSRWPRVWLASRGCRVHASQCQCRWQTVAGSSASEPRSQARARPLAGR